MTALAYSRLRPRLEGGLRALAIAAGVLLGSVVVGWWYMTGPLGSVLPVAVAAAVILTAVGRWNFGGLVALLALVVLNGIPGPDLEQYAASGSFRVSDLAAFALIGTLVLRQTSGEASVGTLLRTLRWWGFALASWWTITLARTVIEGDSLFKSGLFARDFLYFALLLPLIAGGLRTRREVRACLGILAAAAVCHALGQLAISAAGVTSSAIYYVVHTTYTNEYGGIHRIYSRMDDAVAALLPIALGLALLPPAKRVRLPAILLVAVSALSVLFQLTRATYLGLALAIVLVGGIWMYGNPVASAALRRTAAAAALVVIGVVFAVGYRPYQNQTPQATNSGAAAVSTRAVSSIEELQQRSGTVGYRYSLESKMLKVLGGQWPVGLGFWHPLDHPVPALPDYSIRNTDTGVLNAVMTMGAVGAALIYLPCVVLLVAMSRRRRDDTVRARADQWLYFGASTWILYVLIGSVSLVTLFSPSGLVLTATVLGCAARMLDWSRASATHG
jgi:hypothetical protein